MKLDHVSLHLWDRYEWVLYRRHPGDVALSPDKEWAEKDNGDNRVCLPPIDCCRYKGRKSSVDLPERLKGTLRYTEKYMMNELK